MAYIIKSFSDNKYVLHVHKDKMEVKDVVKIRHDVNNILKMNRWYKILSDLSKVTSKPKPHEIVLFIKEMLHKLPIGVKIALLVQPGDEEAVFIENVAQNRGVNLLAFHKKEKAKMWLLHGK